MHLFSSIWEGFAFIFLHHHSNEIHSEDPLPNSLFPLQPAIPAPSLTVDWAWKRPNNDKRMHVMQQELSQLLLVLSNDTTLPDLSWYQHQWCHSKSQQQQWQCNRRSWQQGQQQYQWYHQWRCHQEWNLLPPSCLPPQDPSGRPLIIPYPKPKIPSRKM